MFTLETIAPHLTHIKSPYRRQKARSALTCLRMARDQRAAGNLETARGYIELAKGYLREATLHVVEA